MKFIVVDVGNTSTAVGLWSDGRVSNVSHVDGTFEEAASAAEKLVGAMRGKALDGIAYVSVVPKKDSKWKRWAKEKELEFHQLTYEDSLVRLDYPQPETIGVDRLCDAAAAVERYGAPVLVMDFGTALTAAVVTADKVWRGGVIAPGFPLMRDYLFERTAKLPRMELKNSEAPRIGRSTEEAMRFGAIVGYRGMVKEIVAELRKNFKADFRLVATGGFAAFALKDCGLDFTIDPDLTLFGAGLLHAGRLAKSKAE